MRILIINGVNMNMLGVREPDKYGTISLKDLEKDLYSFSFELGVDIETFQSNHEGEIVEKIHSALNNFDGIVINPAAYTHTSIAILDALKCVNLPAVEVHISDVSKREDFRQVSYIREACIATVMGEGIQGYCHALEILVEYINEHKTENTTKE